MSARCTCGGLMVYFSPYDTALQCGVCRKQEGTETLLRRSGEEMKHDSYWYRENPLEINPYGPYKQPKQQNCPDETHEWETVTKGSYQECKKCRTLQL